MFTVLLILAFGGTGRAASDYLYFDTDPPWGEKPESVLAYFSGFEPDKIMLDTGYVMSYMVLSNGLPVKINWSFDTNDGLNHVGYTISRPATDIAAHKMFISQFIVRLMHGAKVKYGNAGGYYRYDYPERVVALGFSHNCWLGPHTYTVMDAVWADADTEPSSIIVIGFYNIEHAEFAGLKAELDMLEWQPLP